MQLGSRGGPSEDMHNHCVTMRYDRIVANGYMKWFNENGKPFTLSQEEGARVIPKLRLETVANGYKQWFYKNGKPFIQSQDERSRVIPRSRPERPRQQHGSRSTSASTAMYPPPGPDFGFNYGMVQHTSPGSLFATDLSGSGAHDENKDEDDAEVDEDKDEDNAEAVRRNLPRNCHPSRYGTGGHRRH
ncbi:hypothetical protein V6N13_104681 [Hibiscus sabdariffa]